MSAGLGIRGPAQALSGEQVAKLPAVLGVYEILDGDSQVLCIGYAGGRSLFGLRSELQTFLSRSDIASLQFRSEINMQYLSRWKELLMAYVAAHGALPPLNAPDDASGLGRLG